MHNSVIFDTSDLPKNLLLNSNKKRTYKDAGVDIQKGNQLASLIGTMAKSTCGPEVLKGIGGFGALFRIDPAAGHVDPGRVPAAGVGSTPRRGAARPRRWT